MPVPGSPFFNRRIFRLVLNLNVQRVAVVRETLDHPHLEGCICEVDGVTGVEGRLVDTGVRIDHKRVLPAGKG